MPLSTAPVLAAALLIVGAAIGKFAHPRAAQVAMHRVGLPSSTMLVTLLALFEMATGTAVLVWASRPAIACLGLCYLAFAIFVQRLSRIDEGGSCGCFGESSTPAHGVHVVTNLVLAAVALWGLVAPPVPITELGSDGIAVLIATGLSIVATTGALYIALTALPEVLSLLTPDEAPEQTAPVTVELSSRPGGEVSAGV